MLARDRRLSFDGQGLVRPARTGPLVLDAEYDPEVLRHVSMLKLAEEEARVLVGEPDAEALASLGVPEILVTFGSEGSLVFADGRARAGSRAHARRTGSTRPEPATPSRRRISSRARPATRLCPRLAVQARSLPTVLARTLS